MSAVQPKEPSANKSQSLPASSPEIHLSKVATAAVISSLLNLKKNKRVKESTLETYEKRLSQFQRKYAFLPLDPETIMTYQRP
jgi:hypothetical protein